MRVIRHPILCFAAIAAIAASTTVYAADTGRSNLLPDAPDASARGAQGEVRVRVQAILVIASDSGETDASLRSYERNLRSMLRTRAFRRVGGGEATIAVGGQDSIPLGAGQRLAVQIKSAWDNQVMAGIRWWNGDLTLANTTMMRPRKSHSVLAGPSTADGEGTYAVIVVMN